MAYTEIPTATTTGGVDALGTLLTTGYTRSGISVARSKSFVDGFATMNNWKITAGTSTPAATIYGGAVQASANLTMTVNSFSPTDATGVPLADEIPRLVSVDGTTALWAGFKFRIGTVGNSSSFFLFGFRDPANNKGVQAGYFGTTSTATYAAWRFDGTNQDAPASTIAIDTGWHTGELWVAGAGYFFSIDNETPIGIANGTHTISGSAATLMWNVNASGSAVMQIGAVAAIWGTPY